MSKYKNLLKTSTFFGVELWRSMPRFTEALLNKEKSMPMNF